MHLRQLINNFKLFFLTYWLLCLFFPFEKVSSQELDKERKIELNINIRGVYSSGVSLRPFEGYKYGEPVGQIIDVKKNATIEIPNTLLPRQFLLRMDFRAKPTDHPYPSELVIYINKQDIELSVNPNYISADSLFFGNDNENPTYLRFMSENQQKREQLGFIEQLLAGYQSRNTRFYKIAIREFEKRKNKYKQWIDKQILENDSLFVSHLFQFQKIPFQNWKLKEAELLEQKINNFFSQIDLSDTLLLRTEALNQLMNGYMSLFSLRANSELLRDSLFTEAGDIACTKASKGHPRIYGWMVDYFYRGYEQFGIDKGMLMLKKHIDKPNCLTQKRLAIETRLRGMEKLIPGAKAPDFEMSLPSGERKSFYNFNGKQAKYKLLLFWSADCQHCLKMVNQLNDWYHQTNNKGWMDIFAVNLDTPGNIEKWKTEILKLEGWIHIHPEGDINSEIASKYAILSTPVFFLIDSKDHTIVETGSELSVLNKIFD